MADDEPRVAAASNEPKRTRFFTAAEVVTHNRAEARRAALVEQHFVTGRLNGPFWGLEQDCWVAIYNRVLDLSQLISQNRGAVVGGLKYSGELVLMQSGEGILTQPLIRHAGEDISHWFDRDTLEVKTHVDPARNVELPFLPYGRFLHVAPPEPTATWNTADLLPWWRDPQYVVGFLTKRARWIEIVNVLTQQRHALQVCCEETIEDIQTRYLAFNAHAKSYTWKYLDDDEFVPLQMDLTLEANGIADETPLFERLDMDEHVYKPSLYIYFNDDLSVA